MNAKAIVGVDRNRVEVRDVELGDAGEWDLRVELERSAISVGTEAYVLSRQSREGSPYIPGYAPVGRVVHAGEKAAARFRVGDRVSYFAPRAPVNMRQGCGGHQSPGIVAVDPEGRLRPDNFVVKVPEALSSERAAFGGVSAVSHMGAEMCGPRVGDRALVIGQGIIGQFAAQHFRLLGAEVAVADLNDNRLALAKETGADHLINPGRDDLAETVRAIWPEGADIVADSTGDYGIIEASVDAIRYRGTYVFLAWCKGADFNLPRFHNRVFEAYFPWTLEGPRVLCSWRHMVTGSLKVDPLITHRFKLEDAARAYELVTRGPGGHLGILIEWT